MTGDSSTPESGRGATEKGPAGDRGAGPTEESADVREPTAATPLTQQIGRAAVAALAVLFGVFAAVNLQRVSFDWIFGETQARTELVNGEVTHVSGGVPLILLLVAAFALGAIISAFFAWRQAHKGRRRGTER